MNAQEPDNQTSSQIDAGGGDSTNEGLIVGRDQHVQGDYVAGDKVGGDKVLGNKIVNRVTQFFAGDVDAERARREERNRQAMIERVRHAWIEGVLEKSLYHEARIELGLTEQPEAVERPWAMYVQEQGRPARKLPPGVRMSEVFDELGGSLLILGAPGTGKTTLLLELANDLLDRAKQVPDHPIPVVFNLSSWAAQRKPLAEWLVEELNEFYCVPRKVARVWVEDELLLPLLDGLDEVAAVHRAGCVDAINTYRQEHGLVPMAVCSRTEEFKALWATLRVQGAVAIEPLTRAHVDAYLLQAGTALAGIREAVAQDVTLYELLDTPLMFSVMAMAYKGELAAALGAARTAEEQREQLFAAYVEAMHRRRGARGQYVCAQSERWLAWLAAQMRVHNQNGFLIERVQSDWLWSRGQQRVIRWAPLLASGLVLGVAFGLLEGWSVVRDAATLTAFPPIGLIGWVGRSLGYGLHTAIIGGLVYGLVFGLAILVFSALIGYAKNIRPVETLRWSWQTVRAELRYTLLGGLAYGLILGGVVGLTSWRSGRTIDRGLEMVVGLATGGLAWLVRDKWFSRNSSDPVIFQTERNALIYGIGFALLGMVVGRLYTALWSGWVIGQPIVHLNRLIYTLVSGLTGTLAGTLVGGALGGSLGGLDAGLIQAGLAARAVPNEGIHRSAANALGVSLVSGLGVAFGRVLTDALATGTGRQPFWLRDGVLAGLVVGLSGGLLYGGIPCLQHLILRFLLWRNDLAPWPYARFLDHATERIFLRKVGGGYIFIHRLLQDYFAGLWETEYGGTKQTG